MGQSADRQRVVGVLARQAKPLRHWLTGYFRRRVREDSEIEDLVQEVFARMVARDSNDPIEHLHGYMVRTAASVVADRARQRTTRHADGHVAFNPDLHGHEDFDPERVLSGREELDAAAAALLGLPERTRTVFILRRFEGYRYREIAEHMGISVSAVEKHLVRALQHLSAEMDKRLDT